MSATAATLAGQRAAEALMIDTCTIDRRGATTTDLDTGVVTPVWSRIYTGPCKVQESGGFASTGQRPEAGEHAFTVQRYMLHLPIAVTDPTEGDILTITSIRPGSGLDGRTYRLAGEFAKTFATARRIQCEETVT